MNKKIAFVASWYGENIPGGSEAELRDLVHHLQDAGIKLEVLTTCIKSCDKDLDGNFYKPGVTEENGITVRRFIAEKRFPAHVQRIQLCLDRGRKLCREEEEIYCREMANSWDMMNYIMKKKEEYGLFVFIPFMRGTTVRGCLISPEKSVIIPCVHDEPCFDMECLREAYSKVKGMIFHSLPEQRLAEKLYGVKGELFTTLGEAVETSWRPEPERFRQKYGITEPFILYAGRKTAGKRLPLLIKCFQEYKKIHSEQLKLIIIGSGITEESDDKDIIDLGFVSQQDKYDAYGAAEFLCNPSTSESFSLVIMESWLAGRPVIVNEQCDVTKHFAEESKGGFTFGEIGDFIKKAEKLLNDPVLASEMGENGKKYVMNNFSWDVIEKRYMEYFERAGI